MSFEVAAPYFSVEESADDSSIAEGAFEIDVSSKPTITEEELDDRVLEAIVTARRVASNFGISVELGEAGRGSFCRLSYGARSIVLDPEHIKESPESSVFVPAHEGAHAAISIGPAALGLSTERAIELGKKIGFFFLHNCQEDGSVNSWSLNKFPGLKSSMSAVYDKQLLVDNPEMSTPEVSQLVMLMGGFPRFAQFGSEILKIWYTGHPSQSLDPDVRLAIERTRFVFERAIAEIPGCNVEDRDEVLRKARTRWHLMTDHVWPEMERLVELDLNDEKLKEILKVLSIVMKARSQAGQAGQCQGGGGIPLPCPGGAAGSGMGAGEGDPNGSPSSSGSGAGSALGDGGQQQGNSSSPAGGGGLPLSADQLDQLESAFDRAIKKRAEAMAQEYRERGEDPPSQEDLESYLRRQVEQGGGLGVPIQALPKELSKAVEDYKSSLTPEQRRQLEEESAKRLEDLEDALNQQLEAKFSEDKPPSHADIRAQEEKATERLTKMAREITVEKEVLEQLKQARESSLTDYEKIQSALQPAIDEAYGRLNRILLPQEAPLAEVGYSSGFRVNVSRYMQSKADPQYLDTMWERRQVATERSHAFKVVVDISGSMKGNCKDYESQRGVVFLAELLSRLCVPVSIDAFSDQILELKDFDTPLAASVARTHIGGLVRLGGGGTHDATAIAKGYSEIKQLSAEHKYIVVITDAQSGQAFELKSLTKRIREEGEVVLIHFGIGQGTADNGNFYQFSYGNLTTDGKSDDFFNTFSRVIESTIIEPWEFSPIRSGDYRRLSFIKQQFLRSGVVRR